MPSVFITSVPCAGAVFAVTVRLEPRSLARTEVPVSAVPDGVVAVSLRARGPTVTDTVALDVCPEASVTV